MLGVPLEALADADAMTLLGEFSSHRRAAVMQIVAQARQRGERIDKTVQTLAVDQLFGLLWYRQIFGDAALDKRTATLLARAVVMQLRAAIVTWPPQPG